MKWIQREIASTVFDFDFRATNWRKRATHSESAGHRAYSLRQCHVWTRLRDDALIRGQPILKVSQKHNLSVYI